MADLAPDPDPAGRRGRGYLRAQLPSVVWVALIWLLLWGELSVGNVLAGLAVGAVVVGVARQPARRSRYRPSALGIARLIGYFLAVLGVSTVRVTRLVLARGPLRPAIIAVPIEATNLMVVALVANCVTLTPGTLLLEVDVAAGRLWVHAFDAADRSAQDAVAAEVRHFERLALRALRPTPLPGGAP